MGDDTKALAKKVDELGDKIRDYLEKTTGQHWQVETVIIKWDLQFKFECNGIKAVSSSLDLAKVAKADIDELSRREGIMIKRYYTYRVNQ